MIQSTTRSTKRSRAELQRAVETSEARFKAIVDRSADGVVVVGIDGAIQFVNPAAECLLGRTAKQLLGEVFGVPIVPGDVTEIELLPHRGQPRSAEMRVVQTEWLGQPAYLATLRDVTQRKRREEEAKEGVRRRDEFLATLSHELRNPLAAIVHSAQVLCHGTDGPAAVRRTADVIAREGHLMTRLLDDLLDITRVSRGKMELQREHVDVRDVARAAAAAAKPAMRSRKVQLHVQLCQEPLPVHADPARLEQVLMNLLTNAARYGKAGGGARLETCREGMHVVVRVSDDGIGVEADRLETIFEPFQQGEVGLDRQGVGLGIGLTLVRSLVEMHGGQVAAHSDGPDCGSEFTVRLPLSVQPEPAPTPPVAATPPSAPVGDLRVLVVEDNDAAREMLHTLLDLEGYDVATAADARAAMELLEFQSFDVALIDIGLPEIDGFELAQQIRSHGRFDGVYLIALTGYGQAEDRRRALEAGFDVHLVKPLDFAKFHQVLAQRNKARS